MLEHPDSALGIESVFSYTYHWRVLSVSEFKAIQEPNTLIILYAICGRFLRSQFSLLRDSPSQPKPDRDERRRQHIIDQRWLHFT
jgi:hypothetical protein